MPGRVVNQFLLHLLIRDIGPSLRGRRIEAIRLLKPLVAVQLGGRPGPDYLVLILSTPGPFCYYGPDDPLEGEGVDVLKRVYGDRIGGVPEPPRDRVLRLRMEKSNHTLTFSLHGSAAKIRVEGPDTIVESLDARESGTPAGAPVPPGENLATLADESLASVLDEGRAVHGIEGELLDAFTLSRERLDTAALVSFRNGVRDGSMPFTLGTKGRLGRVVPLPQGISSDRAFRKSGELHGPFDGAREACLSVGKVLAGKALGTILDRHSLPVRKRLASRNRLVDTLHGQLKEADAFDDGRKEANILAAYQSQVPARATEVDLPDLYAPGETVTIRLDPALPLNNQIEKRFKRATKLERSRAALSRRIGMMDEEVRALQEALAEVEKATSFRQALQLLSATAATHGLRRRAPVQPSTPQVKQHRRFDLGPQWFVLVGRNDRENDDITFHVAAPDDIWMHAQQTAGSHIVLRSTGSAGDPPRTVLETAAAIAAFYSKARHSGLVPVIYTRRKYVRKFRGAKPGQVTCEREKTLFVEPKLPT